MGDQKQTISICELFVCLFVCFLDDLSEQHLESPEKSTLNDDFLDTLHHKQMMKLKCPSTSNFLSGEKTRSSHNTGLCHLIFTHGTLHGEQKRVFLAVEDEKSVPWKAQKQI